MEKEIKVNALVKQMKRYNRLLKKDLTPERWTARLYIEDNARHFLEALSGGRLNVKTEDAKVLAKYIHTFAKSSRDELYAKIQPYADFDVKEYAETPKLSLWQKMFSRQSEKDQYLTANQMKKRYREYRKVCKAVEHNGWSEKAIQKQYQLRDEAMDYVDDILNDKVVVKAEDLAEFGNYVSIICHPVYDGSPAQQVLHKVRLQGVKQSARPTPQTQSQPAKKTSFWKRLGSKIKVAALSTLAVAGSLLGVKSCEGMSKIVPSQPQAKVIAVPQQADTVKTFKIQPAPQKNTQVKAKSVKSQVSSEQKVWNNYYDNAVEILSSATKKSKLYAQIDRQIADNIFALPKGVSKEKLAYCYTIYKEYGVKSSLKNALTSTKKLSQAEVLQMVKDINAAGKKGEGVKKMAAQLNHGKLSSYSKYDRAPSHLQKRHAKTLKDIMQAKKAANVR